MDEAGGTRRVSFRANGKPQPAGSKRAFPIRRKEAGGWVHTGRVAVTDDNPHTKTWQGVVADSALAGMMRAFGAEPEPLTGAIGMVVIFTVRRPKGHFGTGRNAALIKASAPLCPITKPDTTKLLRAVEDAMTGVVWNDDAQVVEQSVSKVYGTHEGVYVTAWEL